MIHWLTLAVVLSAPLISIDEPMRFLNAYDIGAACQDVDSPVSNEVCYAFLLGVSQTHATLGADAGAVPRFCLPAKVTRRQLMNAVRKHIRRAPGELDEPADTFVMSAFARTFPCK